MLSISRHKSGRLSVDAIKYVRNNTDGDWDLVQSKLYVENNFHTTFWDHNDVYYYVNIIEDEGTSYDVMVRDMLNAICPDDWDWAILLEKKKVRLFPMKDVTIECNLENVTDVVRRWGK